MNSPIWYRNGAWHDDSSPGAPIDDLGSLYGAVVTDRLRTFGHRLFQLEHHIERFCTSCALCHVELPSSRDQLKAIVNRLVETNLASLNPNADLTLIMMATPGPVNETGPPTLIAFSKPVDFERYRPMFANGARLVIPSTRQIPVECIDPRAKHRSRMHWWIAQHQARKIDSQAEALIRDRDGLITETASANVIVVKNGELFTPPVGTVLPGISLQVTREISNELGHPIRDRELLPEDCYSADEILLTCTSYCLAGVGQIDGRAIPWPGPLYQQLLAQWSKRVGIDIVGQILNVTSAKRR